MKKKSRIGICLFFALCLLGGCSNSKLRAEKVDNWARIKHHGTVVVGLDDSFVPMDFVKKTDDLSDMTLIWPKLSLKNAD